MSRVYEDCFHIIKHPIIPCNVTWYIYFQLYPIRHVFLVAGVTRSGRLTRWRCWWPTSRRWGQSPPGTPRRRRRWPGTGTSTHYLQKARYLKISTNSYIFTISTHGWKNIYQYLHTYTYLPIFTHGWISKTIYTQIDIYQYLHEARYLHYLHRYQEEMLARVMELHQLARAGGGQAPGGMLAMWDIPNIRSAL